MLYIQIYLILGLALLVVVLKDYRSFKEAILRTTKESEEDGSELPHKVLVAWNVALYIGHIILLWPIIFYLEFIAVKEEEK